jgi:hypothetical protein
LISNQPRYKPNENWLTALPWNELPSNLESWRDGSILEKNAVEECSISANDGCRQCRIVIRNQIDNARSELFIDVDRGCCLESEQWYDARGRLYHDSTYTLGEVLPGLWFPVAMKTQSFDPNTGRVAAFSNMELILEECEFNQPEEIADSEFEIEIEANMTVHDKRGGERVRYTGETTPLASDKLHARIEAGLLGIEPAAPSSQWSKQLWSRVALVQGVGLIAVAFVIWRRRRRTHPSD